MKLKKFMFYIFIISLLMVFTTNISYANRVCKSGQFCGGKDVGDQCGTNGLCVGKNPCPMNSECNCFCSDGETETPETCSGSTPCGSPGNCYAKKTYYLDSDGDSFYSSTTQSCSNPSGNYITSNNGQDCNDDNNKVYPGAPEFCDYVDNQCPPNEVDEECSYCGDGLIDRPNDYIEIEQCDDGNNMSEDGCSSNCVIESSWFCEGATSVCTKLCGNNKIDPGELCDDGTNNGLPNHCNLDCTGSTSTLCGNNILEIGEECELNQGCCLSGCVFDRSSFINIYLDNDGDGFGKEVVSICPKSITNLHVEKSGDCNDNPNTGFLINPGTEELCDGIDNNCIDGIDEGCNCQPGESQSCGKTDIGNCNYGKQICLDSGMWGECIGAVDPVDEICDTIDNDCDNQVDEDCDVDFDTYVNNNLECLDEFIDGAKNVRSCEQFSGDCDDTDKMVNPVAKEICDDIDNDCNGKIDDLTKSYCYEILAVQNIGVCKDKTAVCKNNNEVCDIIEFEEDEITCDDIDNDCDGEIDENCACNPGDTQKCGLDVGKCRSGLQTCNDNFEWNNCIGSVNPVDEACDNLDNDCDGLIDENIKESCLMDGCHGSKKCINGQFTECEIVCFSNDQITVKLTKEDINEFISVIGLDSQKVAQAQKTIDATNQLIDFTYNEGKTVINNKLNPSTGLGEVDYTLSIPKCLTKYLDDIEFHNDNYSVIEEDPVIAWHFVEVTDSVDLSYEVKGQIAPACLEKIKGLPIAKVIGLKEKKKLNMFSIIIPIVLAIGLAIGLATTKKPHEKKLKTEQDYEKDFIKKQRFKHLEQIKKMRFKSKQQTQNYMHQLGLSQDEQDWIIKKL